MLRASLKAAAVGGIFAVWAKITIEAFRISWHIISLEDVTVVKQMAMCKRCNIPYFVDEVDFVLCESCGDDLLEK